jgi:DHA3 family macrolide efflux protein-like MFS transporter
MVMVINFFYNATEPLTPLLITNHFKGGAAQLGLWLSLFSAGILVGGLILGIWGGFKRKVVTAQSGLIIMGLTTVTVGLVSQDMFIVGLIANTAMGILLPMINGSFGATLQVVVSPDMQGRAFAFIMSAATLVSPIGLIIAGPFADRFGIQPWFLIAGITCSVMGIVGFFIPDVMGIESHAQPDSSTHLASGE